MTYKVELTDKDISDFISFLSNQIKSNNEVIDEKNAENKGLEEKIGRMKKELSLSAAMSKNNGLVDDNTKYPEGYSPDMLWIDKVKYILKLSFDGLTTAQIIDQLIKIEPKYIDDRQIAVRSISSTVSAKSKNGGELQRVSNHRNEFVYSIRVTNIQPVILLNNTNRNIEHEDLPF
jgi:hypothetical protein